MYFPIRRGSAERPSTFAINAHRLGHRVVFLSAVGDDERGEAALQRAAALGLPTEFIQVAAGRPRVACRCNWMRKGIPTSRFTGPRPTIASRWTMSSYGSWRSYSLTGSISGLFIRWMRRPAACCID